MKLVGYQQPTCLCVMMEFAVGAISLSCELCPLSLMILFNDIHKPMLGLIGLIIAT